ncbi:MAG TPA: nucleotidyltransferase domain-containing protein [Aquella sp.]|nr:nucleotidyltransferase domain-containing protein [Aquella sp.]
MSFGLSEAVIQQITSVFSQFKEIQKVVLYGSRAKGNYKPGSDIDLCLFGNGIDLTLQYKIEQALDDLDLAYKCDVTVYDKLDNQELIEHINRIGINLYSKDMVK